MTTKYFYEYDLDRPFDGIQHITVRKDKCDGQVVATYEGTRDSVIKWIDKNYPTAKWLID